MKKLLILLLFVAAAYGQKSECTPNSGEWRQENDVPYKCVADPKNPNIGHWAVDEKLLAEWKEDEKAIQKREQRKLDLSTAFETRVLSTKEMEEVLGYGPEIFVRYNISYTETEIRLRFEQALEFQAKMKIIENDLANAPNPGKISIGTNGGVTEVGIGPDAEPYHVAPELQAILDRISELEKRISCLEGTLDGKAHTTGESK